MSLINKMLQDLDARGTASGDALQSHIKPVARAEPGVPLRTVLGALAAVLALAVLGAAGWRYLHKRAPAPAQPVRVVMTTARPAAAVNLAPRANAAIVVPRDSVAIAAAPPVVKAIAPAVPASAAPVRQAIAPAVPAPAQDKKHAASRVAGPAKPSRQEKRPDTARRAAEKREPARPNKAAAAIGRPAHPAAEGHALHDADAPAAAAGQVKHDSAAGGREENASQRAEGAYRRALAELQDGRVTEAMSALRQALQADAHHEAARQTLVGLLIEHGQAEEAMRQLQLGLTLDARQPALAMLLARLQIERGGSGVETLMRTLPYAAGNGEYHAFLAGALQRQQRHREAAEQYQAALRADARNGVWWMGLGISLQAEKRDAEAQDAFQKAKASGTLSPELLAFVERKLRQPR